MELLRVKQYPNVFLHFTPNFPEAKSFKYFNKPLGLNHWLKSAIPPVTQNTIVILDPDMILLKPAFGQDRIRRFNDSTLLCSVGCTNRHLKDEKEIQGFSAYVSNLTDKVLRGKPVAQTYGLRSLWFEKLNLSQIVGENSKAITVDPIDVRHKYSVGPPYQLQIDDFQRLLPLWQQFMPRVVEETNHIDILADMYAYSLAAMELELPHVSLDHFMVSKVGARGEAWPWLKQLFMKENSSIPTCENPLYSKGIAIEKIPAVFHYAQVYTATYAETNERWIFQKWKVPQNILSCKMPLLKDPPADLILKQKSLHEKFSAWSVCILIKYINEGIAWSKALRCLGTENLQKKIRLSNTKLKCTPQNSGKTCWPHAYVES